MNRTLGTLLLAAFLLATGCARLPFAVTEPVPMPPEITAAELSALTWTAVPHTLRMRQSGLFEFRGRKVPLVGFMVLDNTAATARLVGMNDLGVKFFDLEVGEKGVREHFVLPELAKYPGFAEAVASSVRRIFLTPRPSREDGLEIDPQEARLVRREAGRNLTFVFGGSGPEWLETRAAGEKEEWRVRFFQYRRENGLTFPAGIVLDDEKAGYRLILWIESVKRSDDGN
jgi:hypothetical protein